MAEKPTVSIQALLLMIICSPDTNTRREREKTYCYEVFEEAAFKNCVTMVFLSVQRVS